MHCEWDASSPGPVPGLELDEDAMPNTLTAAYVVGLTLRGIKCLRGTKNRVGGNGSENRKADVLPPSRLLPLLPGEPFHVQ